MKKCNICGECEFKDFNGRKNVQCRRCHSLSRHRLLFERECRHALAGG